MRSADRRPAVYFRPITRWPGQLRSVFERENARFASDYQGTFELVIYEARRLGADDVVVQLALSESDLRRDGLPRAHARPEHPGVILVLPDSDKGRLSFACDRYGDRNRTPGWQDNLRAIGKSMEALRAVDRWGATQGQQYAGFAELPSTSTSVQEAVEFVAHHAELTEEDVVANPERACRLAAKRVHPDHGGDAETFNRLQHCLQVLAETTWGVAT